MEYFRGATQAPLYFDVFRPHALGLKQVVDRVYDLVPINAVEGGMRDLDPGEHLPRVSVSVGLVALMWRNPVKTGIFLLTSYGGYCYGRYCLERRGFRGVDALRYLRSWLMSVVTVRLNDGVRKAFNSNFLLTKKGSGNVSHSHGEMAAQRTQAEHSIANFAAQVGYEPYAVSASSRTEKTGVHFNIMGRDLLYTPSYRCVGPKSMITMVDVDYYLDMPAYLASGAPVLMYTFSPKRAAGTLSDGYYTVSSNQVTMRVNGGATYVHGIWDYDHDFVRVDGFAGSMVCSVEYKELDDERRLVLIVPECYVPWPFNRWVSCPVLDRVRYCTDTGVNVVTRYEDGKLWLSMGREGSTSCVDIPETLWTSIAIRYKESNKPAISDVERIMNASKIMTDSYLYAPLVFDFLKGLSPQVSAYVRLSGGTPKTYSLITPGGLVTEDGKTRGRAVAPPLVDNEAVVPDASYNSERAAVQGRVVEQQNNKEPPGRFYGYAAEFVKAVVPEAGIGVPYDAGVVWERQDRPTQRALAEKVWSSMSLRSDLGVQAFVKGESYAKATDPRIISNVDPEHKVLLSRYTLSFKNLLAEHRWYAPGLTPPEIARRVVEVCHGKVVAETDYSRFDGTISRWLREYVEQAAYLRWVAPQYAGELRTMLVKEVHARCVTLAGYRYRTVGQRLSGSPLTTDGNTLINAFVSFCALREGGQSVDQAMAGLGVYAGDDGLTSVDSRLMEHAASVLGLNLKVESVATGPLKFLGRVFRDPMAGDPTSIQDPVRTLRKLHLSFAGKHIEDAQALVNKAGGYLLLDPDAPLVGDWCKRMLLFYSAYTVKPDLVDLPYYARPVVEGRSATWPQLRPDEAEQLVSLCLGTDVGTIWQWRKQIEAAVAPGDLWGIVHLDEETPGENTYEPGNPMSVVPDTVPAKAAPATEEVEVGSPSPTPAKVTAEVGVQTDVHQIKPVATSKVAGARRVTKRDTHK